MAPTIRALDDSDVPAFRVLRMRALREEPQAFLVSPEEEAARSDEDLAARFRDQAASGDGVIFAAEEACRLVGMLGYFRQAAAKSRHAVVIWGAYVEPEHRGRGLGRRLLEAALGRIRSLDGVEQVELCVITTNVAARSLYARAGFVTWGRQPGAMKVDGRLLDEEHCVLRLQ